MKSMARIVGMALLAVFLMGDVFWTTRSATHPAAQTSGDEMREVARIIADSGKMRDSCVPPHPFPLPTLKPMEC